MNRTLASAFLLVCLAPFVGGEEAPSDGDKAALAETAALFMAPFAREKAIPDDKAKPVEDKAKPQDGKAAELKEQVVALRAGRNPDTDPLVYVISVENTAKKLGVDTQQALRHYTAEGLVFSIEERVYYTPTLLWLEKRLGVDAKTCQKEYHDHINRNADFSVLDSGKVGGTRAQADLEAEAVKQLMKENTKGMDKERLAKMEAHSTAMVKNLGELAYTDGIDNLPTSAGGTVGAGTVTEAERLRRLKLPDHALEGHLKTSSDAPPDLAGGGSKPTYELIGDFPKTKDGVVNMQPGDAAMLFDKSGHASEIIRLKNGRYARRESSPDNLGEIATYPSLQAAATLNSKDPQLVYVPRIVYPNGRTSGDDMIDFMNTKERATETTVVPRALGAVGAEGVSNFTYWCSVDTAAILQQKELGRLANSDKTGISGAMETVGSQLKMRTLSIASFTPTTLKWAVELFH